MMIFTFAIITSAIVSPDIDQFEAFSVSAGIGNQFVYAAGNAVPSDGR